MDYQQGREVIALLQRIATSVAAVERHLEELLAPRRKRERQAIIESPQTLRQIADEWLDLGASNRVANAMGRNSITPRMAREMSNVQLRVRQIGKKGLAELRALLTAPSV